MANRAHRDREGPGRHNLSELPDRATRVGFEFVAEVRDLAILERASLESEAVADVREVEFEPGSQWTDDVQDFDMAVEA